jgi:hypothetical protein
MVSWSISAVSDIRDVDFLGPRQGEQMIQRSGEPVERQIG